MQDKDYKSLPSILDIVTESLHLRTARIIKRRMEGASLRDISTEEGLTRTEARSIEKKGLEKIITDELEVREDEYRYVYENYSFEDEFYLSLYNGNQILYYLKNRYEIGFGSIDRAVKDMSLSNKVKSELISFYKFEEDSASNSASVSDPVEPVEQLTPSSSEETVSPSTSELLETPAYISTSDSHDTGSVPQYVRDAINDLWSSFQACGVTEPTKILEQASIFFFLKYLDDAELKNTADSISKGTIVKNLYFDDAHQDCRWTYFHNLEASELLHVFNTKIIPFIKNDLRVDTNLTYAQLVKNIQLSIADPTLLTKIISTIDSITISSYTNLYTVFEIIVSLAGTDLRFMDLVCPLLDLQLDDRICNAFPSNDFSLSAIASYAKSEYKDGLEKVWNKMHFKNDMFHTYNADNHTLLISSLRLLLQEIANPDIQDLDIITKDCGKTFTKVVAKIPSKPTVNQKYVRSSIRSMITANVPSLMYMYGCHEILENNGICVLNVPHKNLTEGSASHRRLRRFYTEENTILGIINLPSYNRDLLIYQKAKPHSFHQTLFIQINDLTDDAISSACSLIYSSEEHIEEYQNRENFMFYVPDMELEQHDYCFGYEEYSTRSDDEATVSENTEPLDDILRRIYNTQSDIDKSISTIKKLLEKL